MILDCFCQDVEVSVDGESTLGPIGIPVPENENEDSKDPNEKAPVRFGWIIGVMVSISPEKCEIR